MSGTKVVPFPRHKKLPRASELLARAVAEGKPTPLEVLLHSMWRLVDEATRLEASTNPDHAMIARVARDRAARAAAEVAPYCHAKIAATILTGDEDGGPVRIARAADRFADLTDEAAERFVRAIARGEMTIEDVDAELTD
jgi:hypothetical protein